MNARELRRKYIEFYESKGHVRHDSAPLVPIDVTGKLDETLLFTGAGMVQFKPYFRGLAKPPSRRLVTSQKCVRAVDIEEVGNPSHLTFFEMLGNFSFGDYFKKDAIEYAWEFLFSPEWLGLDKKKVCVTVFEEDDEAFDLWAPFWKDAGFDPATKIIRLGEDKNYWPAGALSSGPPGPCGPCSEMFFQVAPDEEMVGDYSTDEAAGRWLEIGNLVFMQYEWKGHLLDSEKPYLGFAKDGMDALPQKNIDTGSGLERTAAVISGFASVYETDVFAPIVSKVCALAGYTFGTDNDKDRAVRVIADHIRTASFCICDGILPANNGRGYVLRRLIRRSVLKGQRVLGFDKPFLPLVFPAVIQALSDPYVELIERSEMVMQTLEQEEEQFRRTMHDGYSRFETLLQQKGALNGQDAFFLHDTFGFPLEVTQELAAERGLTISNEEFEECMKKAQERSRSAQGATDVFGGDDEALVLVAANYATPSTSFVGYDQVIHETRIAQISPRFGPDGITTGHFQLCLEETPFYAESGGQVGDTGRIVSEAFQFEVTNTWKEMGLIWNDCRLMSTDWSDFGTGVELSRDAITTLLQTAYFFRPVIAEVDAARRRDITRNHTATHLLHSALREVLGTHVTQAGSLVAPERLRFDFTHGHGMTADELNATEAIVNERVADANAVTIYNDVPLDAARQKGAMMLFGEKYGDSVRMVEVPGFSLELCGGCHVPVTDEIGLFKITSESSSASGVRRIEAVTGRGAYAWVKEQQELLKSSASLLKTTPRELPKAAEKLVAQLNEAKRGLAKARTSDAEPIDIKPVEVGNVHLYVHSVDGTEIDAGKLIVDRFVESDTHGVGLVAVTNDGKVTFLCKVGAEAMKLGAHAGNLAREVAKITGGGGGGSPQFAQAGGKDPAKVKDALNAAPDLLRGQLK